MMSTRLAGILDALAQRYGEPKRPRIRDPLAMILHENIAYLVSDERREEAFHALENRVGLTPARILSADREVLLEIAKKGGMLPEQRVDKLRKVAELAFETGDLRKLLDEPLPKAKRVLRKFPGIGDPGAEKILLFSGTHPFLALESNGLRVLNRLGYGEEVKSYTTTYKSAQGAAETEVDAEVGARIRAHQLLRTHGQELCKRTGPHCEACPLTGACPYARAQRPR